MDAIVREYDASINRGREKTGSGRFKQSGSVSVKGVFKRSEFGYGPFIVEGNSGSTKLVRQNLTYGVNSVKYGQIDFLDRHGSDTNASLKILAVKNLQESRTVETTKVVDVEKRIYANILGSTHMRGRRRQQEI